MTQRTRLWGLALAVVSLAALVGAGCNAIDTVYPREGAVTGRIVRAADGAAIVGAVVTVGDEDGVTDATGAFTIGKIDHGNQRLVVQAAGYSLPGGFLTVNVIEDATRDLQDIGLVASGDSPPNQPQF